MENAFIELFEKEDYSYIHGKSLKRNLTDVLLEDDFIDYLFNKYSNENISLNEIESIINFLKNISTESLYDANKKFFKILIGGYHLKREDEPQEDLLINFIDFDEPDNNNFKIINQFEVVEFEKRIPDAVIFINGLPLVVFEFKSAIKENTTIYDAYEQLTIRYQRDIPELFKYNAFVVISDGVNNKYGTLFTDYDYFYGWNKISLEGEEFVGINTSLSLVKGLFNKNILLDVIKDFIYFPDVSNSNKKVICRYPQYYAVTKLHQNILKNIKPEGDGRGGTYFGATGSGKSLAMLFLSRILMKDKLLKNPTIILITDRTDLETQLSELFVHSKDFLGDQKVKKITSKKDLKQELENRPSGGVYLTNIQKFTEDITLLSERNNIICISDEAHRSQLNLAGKIVISDSGVYRRYGFAKYLHDSLPNAVYVGFTGTPIDETLNVFGDIVDSYTMGDAVNDGIIVELIYNGRAARVNVDGKTVEEIEEYYKLCAEEGSNEYQIEASKKAVLSINKIIGDHDRLERVAEDFVELYEKRVEEGATVEGKTMFVCSTREIAYDFYKILSEQRPEWIISQFDSSKNLSEEEKSQVKEMPLLKMIMTRNKNDEKELYDLLGTKEDREADAIQFKNPKSNFKIAIVVDMWLTGFDVPCLDMICIDKPIKMHNLIQTISRVNRVYEGKDKGLIVDYFGMYNAMNNALVKYVDNFETDELEDLSQSVNIVKDELSILNQMFYNFDSKLYYIGTPLEKLNCLKDAAEFIQYSQDSEKKFMAHVKRLKSAYDLCVISEEISEEEMDQIFFFTSVRSIIYKLTKGDAPDISRMNKAVSELIEEAIRSDGVEDLFISSRKVDGGVDLLSKEYITKISAIPRPNTKIKILERLLRQEIGNYDKINKIKAKSFTERLNTLIDKYNDARNSEHTNDILNDIFDQLTSLIEDFKSDKSSSEDMGMSIEQKAFYDILAYVAEKNQFEYPHEKLLFLSEKIKYIVEENSSYVDWDNREDIKSQLKVDLMILLVDNGYPPEFSEDVFVEVFEQAENFKRYAVA